MPFTIIRNDITRIKVDAIVNAANTDLLMGGGVCGAIFIAAGVERLQVACNKLAPIKTGEAVITPGFNLLAKHVIHAVGPIYHQWSEQESQKLLHDAYTNALKVAVENGCESIAFPLISSGIYGYPKSEALKVATEAIRAFLKEQDLEVYLVVYDKSALNVSEKLLGEVASYIDDHYVELKSYDRRLSYSEAYDRSILIGEDLYSSEESSPPPPPYTKPSKDSKYPKSSPKMADRLPPYEDLQAPYQSVEKASSVGMPQEKKAKLAFPLWEPKVKKKKIKKEDSKVHLDDLVRNLDEPFSQTLLRLIDAKGMTDVEVYKAANIDRKLFSKIRVGRGYTPSKKTILALAIALQLTIEETHHLLMQAGYALSRSQIFDVIVEYFISKRRYDIFEINEVLFSYDQQLLGS